MTHPTPDQLRDFNLGRISNPVLQAKIEDHIGQCDACCAALREAPADPLLERLRGGAAGAGYAAAASQGDAWSEGSGSAAVALESTVGAQQGSTISRTPAPIRRQAPAPSTAVRPQPPAWLPPAALAGAAALLVGALWGVSSLISSPAAPPNVANPGANPGGSRTLAQTNPPPDTAPQPPYVAPVRPQPPTGNSSNPQFPTGNPGPTSSSGSPGVFVPSYPGQHAPGVLIVIPHGSFWYGDYGPVRETLTAAGIKTRLASTSLAMATPTPNSGGGPVKPEILLSNADPLHYAAVVFAGGEIRDFIDGGSAVEDVRRISKAMLENGRLVTSLCAGNAILGGNQILQGVRAARGQYVPEYIATRSGAEWVNQDVVESGQIITGRDFRVAKQFAEHLAQRLLREAR